MRITIFIALFFFIGTLAVQGQQSRRGSYKGKEGLDELSIGLGLGLDYGGIGGNVLIYPQEHIGLFVGAGYTLAGLGYNVGGKFRFNTRSSYSPYLIGMYGYNTAIAVTNGAQFSKLFYGPSFGVGVDRESRRGNGYWSYALLIPIRGSDVDNYLNYLRAQGVVLQNSLSPVAFSIGYHFMIK